MDLPESVVTKIWQLFGFTGAIIIFLTALGWLTELILRRRASFGVDPGNRMDLRPAPPAPMPPSPEEPNMAVASTVALDPPVSGTRAAARKPPGQPAPPRAGSGPETWAGHPVDRWLLGQRLGEGAMGIVYAARDFNSQARVAIKFLKPDLITNPDSLRRFEREVDTVQGVKPHRNLVAVLGRGVQKGHPYYVMEWVEGGSLEDLLQEMRTTGTTLPEWMVASFLKQILQGLMHIHQAGIIHRDLKPGNIMLRLANHADIDNPDVDDYIKIADFGLARAADGSDRMTMSGMVIGTPAYMAPEQVDGRGLSVQSDMYALGCILYEMLTGASPFADKDSLYAILAAHARETPIHPARVSKTWNVLSLVCMHFLEKDPYQRPHGAEEIEALCDLCDLSIQWQRTPGFVDSASYKTTKAIDGACAYFAYFHGQRGKDRAPIGSRHPGRIRVITQPDDRDSPAFTEHHRKCTERAVKILRDAEAGRIPGRS